MNDRDSAYGQQVLDAAIRSVTAGIDADQTSAINAEAIEVLKGLVGLLKQPEAIQKTVSCPGCGQKVTVVDVERATKAAMQLMKMVDVNARLTHFTAGRPDSRQELRGVDWLQALTDEQLHTVQGWIQQAHAGQSTES